MASGVSARADGVSQRQAPRPGPPGHFVPGATAQMFDWLKRAGSGPSYNAGIWHLYRELAEQARAQTPTPEPLSTLLPILRRW
jgi:hypothetical protein